MKKFLILGASSDIGFEVCKKLLKNNNFVLAHYNKNKKKLNSLNSLNSKNLEILKIDFNLDLKNLTKKIKKISDIDVLVNLVGYTDKKSHANTDLLSMIKSIKINALIPQLIIKKCLTNMLKKKWGRILNCSSIGVKFGGGLNTYNYSLSKHCSEFIPGNFREWAKKNVCINNLRIGSTDTGIHKKMNRGENFMTQRIKLIPMQRQATVEEISSYIIYLISEENSYMTGSTISVSGGE